MFSLRFYCPFSVVAIALLAPGCGSSSPPIVVNVTPASPQAIDQGQNVGITASVTNDNSSKGVSWALTGPGSLTSSTGASVTYVSPTGILNGAQQATVTATSIADPTKTASVQVTVNLDPVIPIQTLAGGSVGAAYSQMITLTGGTPPFQWSVYDGPIITGWEVGGSVPDGLTLNATTGAISGTPTGGGTWYFEAAVTDAAGLTAVNGLMNIQVNPAGAAGNPVPFLNQTLVPTAVPPGNAQFTLNVSGAGFVSGATVDFNGTALATTFVTAEKLTAEVPASSLENAATAAITVLNPSPGGGASNVVYFQVAAPGNTVTFAPAVNSPLQVPEPFGIAVGDFNEDGKADLVIPAGTRIFTFLGNGDGTFALAANSPMPIPSPPYDDLASPYVGPVAVGDFNNNGHQGLAIGLFSNLAVVTLFGDGDGTFAYPSTLAETDELTLASLTAADFNADGDLDLAATYNVPVSPSVLLGYSHGAFSPVNQSLQVFGASSAAGDFNRDGKLDLVIGGTSILLGNGDGTFTPGWSASNGGGPAVVADFNGDGKLDLAVCDGAANKITVLLGDGTGNFAQAPGSPIAVGIQPGAIVVGDFNSDGKLDLAIANFGGATITLLLGNGDGTFTPASGSPYAVGNGPYQMVAADFNGDGKLDLAAVNLIDNTVSILLQQ